MIQRLKNIERLDKSIVEKLGKSLNETQSSLKKEVGSCLYNLKEIKVKDENSKIQINQNARCNFELFEKGTNHIYVNFYLSHAEYLDNKT